MGLKHKIKGCIKYLEHNYVAISYHGESGRENFSNFLKMATEYGVAHQNINAHNIDDFCAIVINGIIQFDYDIRLLRDGYKIVHIDKLIQKFKLYNQSDDCHIEYSCKNNMVIATAYDENGKYINHAKAICSPQDAFDFEVGKRIARNRLFGIRYNYD